MKRTDEITNSQDIIDSRNIIARIEELRGQLDALREAVTDAEDGDAHLDALRDLASWLGFPADMLPDDLSTLNTPLASEWKGSDESTELANLEALASECQGYGDWSHGDTLIRESYFTEYAQQLAEDVGAIPDDAKWPCNCIDWEKAAQELQQDYSTVDFDGVPYYVRN